MTEVTITLEAVALPGILEVPTEASGLVVFAHGSGSSRHSPRNTQVADGLRADGLATLLLDLLTEEEARDRANVFDIALLSDRTVAAIEWAAGREELADLRVGTFGASTGAAAALNAARTLPDRVGAVVSRGGRVDLASDLELIDTPALLIVGGDDRAVLELNRDAAEYLGHAEVAIVPGAGHLFEGPGELERVTDLAGAWFRKHLR
ncbi:MAG: dienelactone hydrolase family protein [Actinobacteria bacterium]|nr:dienelactone hydrolase family protein [Actinomycetota bacterium]